MKWIKFSEQPPQSKIFRVRFHERGTHSINALDMETEGQYVIVSNGDKFLKTNIEWLDGTENETIPNASNVDSDEAYKIVDENFKGLWNIIEDKDLSWFYRELIVTCMQEWAKTNWQANKSNYL